MENLEIRNLLKKYNLKYHDILPYITNFSHINRISEELARPLSEERKGEYLQAIKKAREDKIKELEEMED